MVPLDRRALREVVFHGDVLADARRVLALDEMEPRVAALLRVGDAPEPAAAGQFARIADLPTHLRVADGVVEHDGGLALERDDFLQIRASVIVVVTEEMRGSLSLDLRKLDDFFFLRGTRACALLLHVRLKTGDINSEAAFASH